MQDEPVQIRVEWSKGGGLVSRSDEGDSEGRGGKCRLYGRVNLIGEGETHGGDI